MFEVTVHRRAITCYQINAWKTKRKILRLHAKPYYRSRMGNSSSGQPTPIFTFSYYFFSFNITIGILFPLALSFASMCLFMCGLLGGKGSTHSLPYAPPHYEFFIHFSLLLECYTFNKGSVYKQ